MKNILFTLLLIVGLAAGGCSCTGQVREAEQLAFSYVIKDEATYNDLMDIMKKVDRFHKDSLDKEMANDPFNEEGAQ